MENKIKEFKGKVAVTFGKEVFERGCVGSIAEIYDSVKPYEPKGSIFSGLECSRDFKNFIMILQ